MTRIRKLSAGEVRKEADALAAVLVDCVEGGASVSFMAPYTLAQGRAFFLKVADGVDAGDRILLAGELNGRIVGSVQLVTAMPPNQPHRGEVAKLLVHRAARGNGVARALMVAAEEEARAAGKSLLVLDTASLAAERLYESLNWQKVGVIPDFALLPDGTPCPTTIYWKRV